MDFIISVDLEQIHDLLGKLDNSGKRMRNTARDLNEIRKRLSEEDVWVGNDADAVMESYTKTLSSIYNEIRRIEALIEALQEYAEALARNERRTAEGAGRIPKSANSRMVDTLDVIDTGRI